MSVHGTSVVANLVDAPILRTLAAQFGEAGHELYLVGGSVRDGLLHRPTHDLDFATDAHPPVIKRLLAQAQPDSRYDVGEKFGTIGATFGEWVVEITTYRSEEYAFASRKPAVTFGTNLEDDLSRRDFTINAIAQEPTTGGMLDPFHGLQDLQRGVIRAVGDPAARFREDPLRICAPCALRPSSAFTSMPDARGYAGTGARIGARKYGTHRRGDDALVGGGAARGQFGNTLRCGAGESRHAGTAALRGTSQDDRRHKDVFGHTLKVVENAPATPLLRWAALLHDIGKPKTKSVQDGKVHFFRHETVGARMARRIHGVCALTGTQQRAHFNAWWRSICARISTHRTGPMARCAASCARPRGSQTTCSLSPAPTSPATAAPAWKPACARGEPPGGPLPRAPGPGGRGAIEKPPRRQRPHDHVRPPTGPWIKPIKDYLLELVIDGELAQDDRETAIKLAQEFAERVPELTGE